MTITFVAFSAVGQTICNYGYRCEVLKDSTASSSAFVVNVSQCSFKYPEAAMANNIQGIVVISFDVVDCELTNMRVTKGLGYGLDEIAIDIITEMGKDLKKNHASCCTLFNATKMYPVSFKLK